MIKLSVNYPYIKMTDGVELPSVKDVIYWTFPKWGTGNFYFVEENRKCYMSSLYFPPKASSDSGQRVQEQNYEYFIHTMAEMVQKYAPEILEEGEII